MQKTPRKFEGHSTHTIKEVVVICDATLDKDGNVCWGGTGTPGAHPWYLLRLEIDAGVTYRDRYPDLYEQHQINTKIMSDIHVLTNGEGWYYIDMGDGYIALTLDDQKMIQEAIFGIQNEH